MNQSRVLLASSLLLVVLLTSTSVLAQEAKQSTEPESYVVQLTEFRLPSALDPRLTASEIVDRFVRGGDDAVKPVTTVRLSALSDTKCMAQFGRQTAVTTGTITTRPGAVQQVTEMIQVGTMVRFTASPRSGKLLVELSYESSQLEGEGTDSSPPDTVTSQFETAALVELDKPRLIGGTSEGQTSFLLLTVSR